MKQKRISKRSRIENPVWCDHCRIRIAPYEEIEIAGKKAFHRHCFDKVEMKKPDDGPLAGSGLTLAFA